MFELSKLVLLQTILKKSFLTLMIAELCPFSLIISVFFFHVMLIMY